MIQKFGGILEPAYQFTDKFEDLPEALLKNIPQLSVAWKKEQFVAACWIHNFLTSGKHFVLVTSQRVIFRDPMRVTQNMFADITGVERSKLMDNISILSPGNPNKLFPGSSRPGNKLMTILFDIINATWVKARQAPAAGPAPASAGSSIMEQIEQLSGLKDKGILTEEEFQQKKQELLAKL